MSWETSTLGPLGRESIGLLLGWDLTSDQEPEKRLWEWLNTTVWCSWENILALWDGLATEANT